MNKLLTLLQDGRFHSGKALGEALGVSRSSIWKYLQRLEVEQGLRLFKVPGKGYRLAERLSLLEPENCAATAAEHGWTLYLQDSIDSTNAEALRLLQAGSEPPFLVLAETQTSGRGRRGRLWSSPASQNIYFTLVLKITGGANRLSGLSLVVGMAVAQTLRDTGLTDIGVKWPNDVYVKGRKIAGILLELTGDPMDVCNVAIGIGINANMVSPADRIDQPWTSVRLETDQLCDRTALVGRLSETLHQLLQRHAAEGFEGLRSEWEAISLWRGRRCTLASGSTEIKGELLGVNSEGALRLLVDGQERVFSGGELSLRLEHDS
jgi:BirA family biotin operon repressor/biotin-[acetyl-CoA-carboxylase] ligase